MDERGLGRGRSGFYSEEVIVEEKDRRGVTVNKYIRGRFLGKVSRDLFREDLPGASSSPTWPPAASTQPRSSKRLPSQDPKPRKR